MHLDTYILAFDPSTVAVGYCISAGDQVIESGVFKPHSHADAQTRINEIARWSYELFLPLSLPVVVALEEPAGNHGNRDTDRKVAGAGYVIQAAAVIHGIKNIRRYYPETVKRTGCHKHATRAAAAVVGKVDVSGDEADAIGVWLACVADLKAEELERLAQANG